MYTIVTAELNPQSNGAAALVGETIKGCVETLDTSLQIFTRQGLA